MPPPSDELRTGVCGGAELMEEAVENNKVDATYSADYQLKIIGLEVPLLANSKRTGKPKNLPPTELPLFTNKPYEMMATGAPIISATQAYLKHPDWNEYDNGRFYFPQTIW